MGKEYSRTLRVNQLLKEEISHLLRDAVKDTRIGMVTITGVEASPDLKAAKVFFRVRGDESRWEEAKEGLESAAGFMRARLGRELRIRRVPELHFVADHTLERAARIEELLDQVREPDEPDGEEDEG